MTADELEITMIEIVALSGDARTKLLNAVKEAKAGNFDRARGLVDHAQELLNDAHNTAHRRGARRADNADGPARTCPRPPYDLAAFA